MINEKRSDRSVAHLRLQTGLALVLGPGLRHRSLDGDGRGVIVQGERQGHRVSNLIEIIFIAQLI